MRWSILMMRMVDLMGKTVMNLVNAIKRAVQGAWMKIVQATVRMSGGRDEVDKGKQEVDQSMETGPSVSGSESDIQPEPEPEPEPEPPQPDSDSDQEQPDKRSRKRKKKEGAGGLDIERESKKGKVDDGFFNEL